MLFQNRLQDKKLVRSGLKFSCCCLGGPETHLNTLSLPFKQSELQLCIFLLIRWQVKGYFGEYFNTIIIESAPKSQKPLKRLCKKSISGQAEQPVPQWR
jgi:hypothetical protein